MSIGLAYGLSMGVFLSMGLWSILRGGRLVRTISRLIYSTIFILLGVLSIKFIDALPSEAVEWVKILTVLMALVGGMAILLGSPSSIKVEE